MHSPLCIRPDIYLTRNAEVNGAYLILSVDQSDGDKKHFDKAMRHLI